jgi:hypothetical protein
MGMNNMRNEKVCDCLNHPVYMVEVLASICGIASFIHDIKK